jgi:hypothetical protein
VEQEKSKVEHQIIFDVPALSLTVKGFAKSGTLEHQIPNTFEMSRYKAILPLL